MQPYNRLTAAERETKTGGNKLPVQQMASVRAKVPGSTRRWLQDSKTDLVDARWRHCGQVLSVAFIFSRSLLKQTPDFRQSIRT